jgi:sulfatase modifying factor 1
MSGWLDTSLHPWVTRRLGLMLVALGAALLPATVALGWVAQRPARQVWRPELVEVSAGTFQMGSPEGEEGRDPDEARHEVRIERPFLIARTELTQGQYRAVMGVNPSTEAWRGVSLLGYDLPVQNVSWLDAVALCNRLSELEGLRPAYQVQGDEVTWDREADGYRLPTEAEWEYAARAGLDKKYGAVDADEEVCGVGNMADRKAREAFALEWGFDCDDGHAGLAPVGSFAANPWGLYDTAGNVWEWTWDRYAADITGEVVDRGGPSGGVPRVNRGGSFHAHPRNVRVANRDGGDPSYRFDVLGLRLARSLPSAL